jgi:hypothetical protein
MKKSNKTNREICLAEALQVLLDQCDYEQGNCRQTEMVGAVISRDVLAKCRMALVDTTH